MNRLNWNWRHTHDVQLQLMKKCLFVFLCTVNVRVCGCSFVCHMLDVQFMYHFPDKQHGHTLSQMVVSKFSMYLHS